MPIDIPSGGSWKWWERQAGWNCKRNLDEKLKLLPEMLDELVKWLTIFWRAIPRVFPLRTHWALFQSCKQTKNESLADFRTRLKYLFLRHSGFTETTFANQFVLKYLFMGGLFPDLSSVIKHGKPKWEVINLMKFVFQLNILNVL